jgi:lipopolysaccharide export system permease protein
MKRLYRNILKSYFGPFIMTFFIVLFITLMQFLWKYIDDMVGKGLELHIIAKLLFYASATFVPLALPLAILLSSLMLFGNLGERYELVACKAAGISLRKIMQPLMVFTLLLSALAFYFSNNVLPIANLKMSALLYDVREQKPALNIKEGVFYRDIDNYVIKVGEKMADGKTVKDVMIYDHTKYQGNISLTLADSGYIETTPDKRYLLFNLYRGCNYQENLEERNAFRRRPLQRTYFNEQLIRLDLSSFEMERTNEELFKDHYRMMNLTQLEESQDSMSHELYKRKMSFFESMYSRMFHLKTYDTLCINRMDAEMNRIKKKYYQKTQEFHLDTARIDSAVYATLKQEYQADLLASFQKLQKEEAHNPCKCDTMQTLDFLDNFEKEQKSEIVTSALNNARDFKAIIEFNAGEIDDRAKQIRKHKIEWYRKFTLSIACLILFFIGAPLGAIIRKGGFGLPVVISVLFFVVFHVINMSGEKLAREGVVEPMVGMWLASIIIFPVGLFLTMKATTDAPLLEAESWKKIFNKWKRRLIKRG